MIPRLHNRGTSFKGACSYILHDAGKTTNERVLWTDQLNIFSHADDAWFEMYAVARDQAALKQHSGQDARGRKNTKPVLHYTLAWAASDKPSDEHMRETALSSLKALKLDQHQVLMAAHCDKKHLHVHIVVNTIHPETGLTAPLKYTKEHLSRWAEAYEREHAIHCEERIKANQERLRIKLQKTPNKLLRGGIETWKPAPDVPFVPVKHKGINRKTWFERQDITDRMKRLRAEMDLGQKVDRNATWSQQKKARDALDRDTKAACDHARSHIHTQFKPKWRELYHAQKAEMTYVSRQASHPLERAVYVYSQRERLGLRKPLSFRKMIQFIRHPGKLLDRLDRVQARERRDLAQSERVEASVLTDRIWAQHRLKFERLRSEQATERKAERDKHFGNTRGITLAMAKASLIAEQPPAVKPSKEPRPFHRAEGPEPVQAQFHDAANRRSPQQTARVEAIKRQMEEWRKRNPGRDFGREI